MAIKANQIQKYLLNFVRGSYDVVLPNFYIGLYECDVFRITGADLTVEYEIKISRGDFFADFKKDGTHLRSGATKHENIKSGNRCNRFFFVVPENMVAVEEVPPYAGLIYFKGERWFDMKKNAKLLHKNRFTDYRSICRTLAYRDEVQRAKIAKIRNTDFDKEMSALKRELDEIKTYNRELRNELFLLKRHTAIDEAGGCLKESGKDY